MKKVKICNIKAEYYEMNKVTDKKKYVKKNKVVNLEFKEWSL